MKIERNVPMPAPVEKPRAERVPVESMEIGDSVYLEKPRSSALGTVRGTAMRAGWAVVLAGPGGRVLEGVYGTGAAAALIYQASDPKLEKIPNWIDTNEDAMADMKRLAEAEAA